VRIIGYIGWDSDTYSPARPYQRRRYGKATTVRPKIHPTESAARSHGGGDKVMAVWIDDEENR